VPRDRSSSGRLLSTLRRTLLAVFGSQLLLAIGLTLVDSYRRRGKKPKPFPTTGPSEVEVGGGTVTTYTFGQDLYDDMLAAIDGAQRQILFETYIWKADEVGERFKRALTEAADRGVDVYVIYDAFANAVVDPRFKHFAPSLKVLRYPIYTAGLRFYDLRRYGRDHRKILVVDDEVGFVGGYNIGTPFATEWRDTHCRITGPGVWVPRLWMFPIRSMYLEAINRATGKIWLTHAYFIPDQDFVDALVTAGLRGVDVRLLLPAKSNHIVADWLSRGYFGQLLEAGVRIFRFRDAMVHAKTATIDGQWSTIGTANIDRLSMTGNYEINVEFIDDDMATAMEKVFQTDLSNCVELTQGEWESRDIYRRFTEAVLAPLRPLL